jgi:hypothetical protein
MNVLDVEQLAGEIVSRNDIGFQAEGAQHGQRESVQSDASAADALAMVSEAAAAIEELEEQSAQAVARAQNLVDGIAKQLESEEARAERAEMAQRLSEAEVKELSAAFARTRSELETARRQLADTSEDLSQTEERLRLSEAEAKAAQQGVIVANAKIEHIVEAIRTQLPSREDLSAQV